MRPTSPQLALALAALGASVDLQPVPRRMEVGVTPDEVCRTFDVFLNGVRQLCCTIADADAGYVVRYRRSIGRKPVGTLTEVVRGKVEIRRKGEAQRQVQQDDGSAVGGPSGAAEALDRGDGTGAACDAPGAESKAP